MSAGGGGAAMAGTVDVDALVARLEGGDWTLGVVGLG